MNAAARLMSVAMLAAAVVGARPAAFEGGNRAESSQTDKALKAAFIFNFAKFTEWPSLPPGAPIAACIVGDDAIEAALREIVKGQRINGHAIDVYAGKDHPVLRECHIVFFGTGEGRKTRATLAEIAGLPVLTVSDDNGFSKTGGMIEMYVQDQRMNFAINVRAAERSGLRLSSRLLDLARIVKGPDAR